MPAIARVAVPANALLKTYRGGRHPERWQGYGDCFSVIHEGGVSLADFVTAFYSSPLFKVERLILRVLARAPSSDAQARALAQGSLGTFAVWEVGERTATELLMCDRYGRTRSWFQVVPRNSGGGAQTLLQFGSAIAARPSATGALAMSSGFKALLGFHRLYSRLLLRAAQRRLPGVTPGAG
jgi:hypothetical protein